MTTTSIRVTCIIVLILLIIFYALRLMPFINEMGGPSNGEAVLMIIVPVLLILFIGIASTWRSLVRKEEGKSWGRVTIYLSLIISLLILALFSEDNELANSVLFFSPIIIANLILLFLSYYIKPKDKLPD